MTKANIFKTKDDANETGLKLYTTINFFLKHLSAVMWI